MKNIQDIIYKQVSTITETLIETGLCIAQNFPVNNKGKHEGLVSFNGSNKISISLKNLPYSSIYDELLKEKCYNLCLIDGALIQMQYRFVKKALVAHRLAYFPSPYLESYKTAQETYTKDFIYGDVVKDSIVPFSIRFDYSDDDVDFKEHFHSKTHLTLGEFKQCRIPVSSPLSPCAFISIILKHFYVEDRIPLINKNIYCAQKLPLNKTITVNEEQYSYFKI